MHLLLFKLIFWQSVNVASSEVKNAEQQEAARSQARICVRTDSWLLLVATTRPPHYDVP